MDGELAQIHARLTALVAESKELRADNDRLMTHMREAVAQLEEAMAILANNKAKSEDARRPSHVGSSETNRS